MYAVKLRTVPRWPTAARYSGNVSNSHEIPALRVAGSMSSTFSSVPTIASCCSGRVGAIVKPQLPATTVVTPWYDDGRSAGSQNTCAS